MGGTGWVYPRACGGTTSAASARPDNSGLSPRVRGNRLGSGATQTGSRSIPARAGEPPIAVGIMAMLTVYPRACGGTVTDDEYGEWVAGLSPRVRGNPPNVLMAAHHLRVYPRACGGTLPRGCCRWCILGLSPRVRGNQDASNCLVAAAGSIPARAGEPMSTSIGSTPASVYPRACGGTRTFHLHALPLEGLSPRVRGNRVTGW